MKLTDKETKALKAIAQNGLDSMGGNTPKDLHDDNFSWFDLEDMIDTGLFSNKHEASGLISALNEKGLIGQESKNEWFLSDTGIDIAEEIWNN